MTSPLSPEARRSVSRVLIYRLGSLGDTLIALPALHLAARAFPSAERRLLTNIPVNVKAPPAAAILEHTGLINSFFRYTVGTRRPHELLTVWWKLVRWRPEVLIYMGAPRGVQSARRDTLFFRFCGIRHLLGVPDTEEMQQNLLQPDGTLEAEGARLCRNLSDLGPALLEDPASWDLHLTSEEYAVAAGALAPLGDLPLLAVSVGTKVQAKDWGRDNWKSLLARISDIYPSHALALCGAPEEFEASQLAAEGWSNGPFLNLCGRLTPRQSAAVFSHARLFLGHDSGPMHLAAAVGTTCVAIFAARNIPRVWFPYGFRHRVLYHEVDCMGCNLETCIAERKKCLTSITVEEVLREIRACLG